ncbi:GAF domain-containing protein [Sphingomonas aerolata]|uniref:GAF domain-containing protein n=1 Tax=Sphingomonas aerolata TaxID=185951 RepID=UPI002FE27D85
MLELRPGRLPSPKSVETAATVASQRRASPILNSAQFNLEAPANDDRRTGARANPQDHVIAGLSTSSARIIASVPQSASQTKPTDAVSWSGLNLEGGQFDDVVRLAAQICGAPVALVSVIEAGQQLPKASVGITASTAPLSEVICQHTINERDLLVIPDLSADLRTATHPLVTADPTLRFYAGVFLAGTDDKPLGTLCIMDREPRPGGLTDNQAGALAALGRQVVTLLNLQRERSRFRSRVQQRGRLRSHCHGSGWQDH